MTYKENITAILECYFAGFKKEIIDSACNRILEQELCEDAISRKSAVSRISDLIVLELKGERLPTWNEVHNALGELPSVQSKIKVGYWISYWNEEKRCYVYKCSECGNEQPFDTKYCWECGGKMSEIPIG